MYDILLEWQKIQDLYFNQSLFKVTDLVQHSPLEKQLFLQKN